MTNQTSSTELEPIYSEFAADPDYLELIEIFVMGMSHKIADLENAFEAGDRPSLTMLAHQLKGSGGGYGFGAISAVAAELEDACKADDSDLIEETYRRVIADLRRVSA